MSYIAIDPGVSGGVAWVTPAGRDCFPMPKTEADLVLALRDIQLYDPVAFVEEVGGFIGKQQPGSRMFKFGRNFGFILGALQALGIRTVLIKPQKWQKELSMGTSKGMTPTQWKNKLKAEAQRRFPNLKVTLKTADALLILEAGRQMEGRMA